jgi:hypothetical protein
MDDENDEGIGLPLGGFLLASPVRVLVTVASIGIDLTSQFGGVIAGVGTMVLVLLIATILGANSTIGGAIGGLVNGEYVSRATTNPSPETVVHSGRTRSPTVEDETDRAISNSAHEKSASSPKLTDVIQSQH